MPSSDQDFWNGRFASDSYLFGTQPAAFVADNAHAIPKYIVEVGSALFVLTHFTK